MMKIQTVGVALVMALALAAFAGSASAAVLTSPKEGEYTGELTFSRDSSLYIKAGFAEITCTISTIALIVETNTATRAAGRMSDFIFGLCGNSSVVVFSDGTNHYGTLEVQSGGTVVGSGFEVTVATVGTSCVYGGGAGTKLGTLKSGSTTTDATLTISASLPKISGGFLCANPATWTGSYWATKPTPLSVD